MREDWQDPDFARAWDGRADLNPTRVQHLALVLALIEKAYRSGTAILDLGAGSGKLEARLLERLPNAHIVAVDSSQAMLALARERLRGASDRVLLVSGDFEALEAVALPRSPCQIAVSVQALHHVPDDAKLRVFGWVYGHLEPAGLFVSIDRVATPRSEVRAIVRTLLNRLNDVASHASGWTGGRPCRRWVRDHDHPATVARHLTLLREAGFHAPCVDQRHGRAVLTAVKHAA